MSHEESETAPTAPPLEPAGAPAADASVTDTLEPGGDTGGAPGEGGSVAAPAAAPGVPLLRVVPACLLAWAVPGLGHLILGRYARGALFGILLLGLFAGGLALDGKVYRPLEGQPLTYLAALGAAGVGLPFMIAHSAGWADGDVTSLHHDYGNTFTLVAGLLNLLVVLDAFDVAVGRR